MELNKRVTGWWGGRVSYTRSRLMDNQFGQSNYYAATGEHRRTTTTPIASTRYGMIDVPHKMVVAPIVQPAVWCRHSVFSTRPALVDQLRRRMDNLGGGGA